MHWSSLALWWLPSWSIDLQVSAEPPFAWLEGRKQRSTPQQGAACQHRSGICCSLRLHWSPSCWCDLQPGLCCKACRSFSLRRKLNTCTSGLNFQRWFCHLLRNQPRREWFDCQSCLVRYQFGLSQRGRSPHSSSGFPGRYPSRSLFASPSLA